VFLLLGVVFCSCGRGDPQDMIGMFRSRSGDAISANTATVQSNPVGTSFGDIDTQVAITCACSRAAELLHIVVKHMSSSEA